MAAADRAWRKNGPGTQRLRRNLQQVVGPAFDETLVRDGLRSYARYWMEAFRLPSQSREQMLTSFRVVQFDELKAVLGEGNGVILALPHSGTDPPPTSLRSAGTASRSAWRPSRRSGTG